MKKTLLLLLVAMSVSLSGFAQKGRQAVGVDVIPACYPNSERQLSVGVGMKYQYNLTDYIRLVPSAKYVFPHDADKWGSDEYESLQLGMDMNVYLTPLSRVRSYFIAGIYYNHVIEYDKNYDDKDYANIVTTNFGIGLDYRLSYNITLQAEIMYGFPILLKDRDSMLTDKETNQSLSLGIGVAYNF